MYKIGTRIISTGNEGSVPKGELGAVLENGDIPYVRFDNFDYNRPPYNRKAMICNVDIIPYGGPEINWYDAMTEEERQKYNAATNYGCW